MIGGWRLHWGCIKFNVDGAFIEASGEAGIGVACRDQEGRFTGGMGRVIFASTPFMAECMAVREALIHRNRFPESRINVETDCEGLYRLLIGRSMAGCEWRSWDILKEILEMVESLEGVTFSLVSRKGNNAADKIAADAARKMYQPSWLECMPSSFSNILFQDSIHLEDYYSNFTEATERTGVG